jgi:hypothetical protein
VPAQEKCRTAGREAPQDRVGRLAEDRRVVERAAELEEREVERDRDRDQEDRGDELGGDGAVSSTARRPGEPEDTGPR